MFPLVVAAAVVMVVVLLLLLLMSIESPLVRVRSRSGQLLPPPLPPPLPLPLRLFPVDRARLRGRGATPFCLSRRRAPRISCCSSMDAICRMSARSSSSRKSPSLSAQLWRSAASGGGGFRSRRAARRARDAFSTIFS
jgi:hypothetical protein